MNLNFILLTAGVDFVPSPTSVNISRNEPTSCFFVAIRNDNSYELQKEFRLNLTNYDSSALAIMPSFRVISIQDDDGKCHFS